MSILDFDVPNLIDLHTIFGRCVSVLEWTTFSRHSFH